MKFANGHIIQTKKNQSQLTQAMKNTVFNQMSQTTDVFHRNNSKVQESKDETQGIVPIDLMNATYAKVDRSDDLQPIRRARLSRITSQDWLPRGSFVASPLNSALNVFDNLGPEVSMSQSALGSYLELDNNVTALDGNIERTPHSCCVEMTEHDVISGRGTATNNHPGNVKYREIIEKWKPMYRSLGKNDKRQKQEFSILVKQEVERCGARFLAKCPDHAGSWVLMSPALARRKCSQALREGNTKSAHTAMLR